MWLVLESALICNVGNFSIHTGKGFVINCSHVMRNIWVSLFDEIWRKLWRVSVAVDARDIMGVLMILTHEVPCGVVRFQSKVVFVFNLSFREQLRPFVSPYWLCFTINVFDILSHNVLVWIHVMDCVTLWDLKLPIRYLRDFFCSYELMA